MTARDALLDRCVEVLARDGFSDSSLREIATAVGTSHRMLIYHFGSRDGLLADVVGRVEATQRAALADLAISGLTFAEPGAELSRLIEVSRAFWARLSDPALAPAERLFFEVYAQALRGRPWTESFRSSVIAAWEAPLIEMFADKGKKAQAYARLGVAVTRGLLLDLLLTGERDVVDEAMELYGQLVVGAVDETG